MQREIYFVACVSSNLLESNKKDQLVPLVCRWESEVSEVHLNQIFWILFVLSTFMFTFSSLVTTGIAV